MARTDQFVGLTERALDIVVNCATRQPADVYETAWNGCWPLHLYTMKDGTVYMEYVQETPWSSGPMYFLGLKDKDGNPIKDLLWTEEEIEKMI